MYGIINKTIQDLITNHFGEEKWNEILLSSGIKEEYFISNQTYDDEVTYKLAIASAEKLNLSTDEILETLGQWWILKTTQEKYKGLMDSGGKTLKDFLTNLPQFHNRIMLIYTKITPPEFKITDISEKNLNLHYFSKREGLHFFVKGLIQGLAIYYDTPIEIKITQNASNIDNHTIFNVKWR